MATQNDFDTTAVPAGADLRGQQHKAVTAAGIIAAQTTALGLLQNKPNTGETATVGYSGEMKAYAGAAISAGARVTGTNSGYFIAATSGAPIVGRCGPVAAGSGDLFVGVFDFASPGVMLL
jgi:hypothetical protein